MGRDQIRLIAGCHSPRVMNGVMQRLLLVPFHLNAKFYCLRVRFNKWIGLLRDLPIIPAEEMLERTISIGSFL
jgi:hypothetical protein